MKNITVWNDRAARAGLTRSVFIFVFAVLVGFVFLAVLPASYRANDNSDYDTFYGPMAQHIADGKGMIFNGRLPARYPPGFPAYLAPLLYLSDAFGIAKNSAIVAANVVFTALGCVLLERIATIMFTPRIGLLAVGLWITYPLNLWLLKQPNSEVPFIAVLYLALWLFLRCFRSPSLAKIAVTAALLALATLIRPVSALLPIVLLPILLWNSRDRLSQRLLYASIFAGAFIVPLLPWEIAVHAFNHELIFLSTGASHGVRDGLTFTRNFDTGRRGRAWVPAAAEDLAQRIYEHQPPLQTTGDVVHYLGEELQRNPLAVPQMAILKAARSWYGTDAMTHEIPIAIVQLIYLLLAIFGVMVAWRKFPQSRILITVLLAVVLYFWGMTILVLSIVRYMVPAMGVLMTLGAVALNETLSFVHVRKLLPGHPS